MFIHGRRSVKYVDSGINKKAMEAFDFLTFKCSLRRKLADDCVSLRSGADEDLGTYLVVGANIGEKVLRVPKEELPKVENGKIAVVLFSGEEAKSIYLFDIDEVQSGKPHRLYKSLKRKNFLGIKIKNAGKPYFEEHKFGVVLEKHIKNVY